MVDNYTLTPLATTVLHTAERQALKNVRGVVVQESDIFDAACAILENLDSAETDPCLCTTKALRLAVREYMSKRISATAKKDGYRSLEHINMKSLSFIASVAQKYSIEDDDDALLTAVCNEIELSCDTDAKIEQLGFHTVQNVKDTIGVFHEWERTFCQKVNPKWKYSTPRRKKTPAAAKPIDTDCDFRPMDKAIGMSRYSSKKLAAELAQKSAKAQKKDAASSKIASAAPDKPSKPTKKKEATPQPKTKKARPAPKKAAQSKKAKPKDKGGE